MASEEGVKIIVDAWKKEKKEKIDKMMQELKPRDSQWDCIKHAFEWAWDQGYIES